MRLTGAGNLGIGNSGVIGQRLTVDTATAWDGIMLQNAGNPSGFIINNASSGAVMGLNASGVRKINLDTNGTSYVMGGNVGIGTSTPQTALDVNGGVRVGTASTCNASTAGTMRYNSGAMEYCNSSAWVSLSPPAGSMCGFASTYMTVNCQGSNPTFACPSGYTSTTLTDQAGSTVGWTCMKN